MSSTFLQRQPNYLRISKDNEPFSLQARIHGISCVSHWMLADFGFCSHLLQLCWTSQWQIFQHTLVQKMKDIHQLNPPGHQLLL